MKRTWSFLTSLRLTIYLLGMSTVLVFFGTLDQVQDGIYLTQQRYFEHVFVVFSRGQFQLPLPGGYLLGPLLVLNLVAAHFRYYRSGLRKVGIALLHLGVVLLLIGQFLTQVRQEENFMWLAEGEQSNYIESFYTDELVVVDRSDPEVDKVVAWPRAAFSRSTPTTLRHPSLPFTLEVVDYHLNAAIVPRAEVPQAPNLGITEGIGAERGFSYFPQAPVYAQDTRNVTTALVDIHASEGSLGRWLVSNVFRSRPPTAIPLGAQTFSYNGKTYEIALRYKRTYLPAQLKLLEFSHDRYPGTNIPHNFSSEVRIMEPGTDEGRSTLIYMNHPLRYAGFTFYQASFGNNDTMSMFQVVRNPARWVPYIACLMITVGMIWQFLFSLARLRPRKPSSARAAPTANRS